MEKEIIVGTLVILEFIMSIVTLFAYKIDKVKAKNGSYRIKEKTLLIMPWLMGGIGGFMGVYVVRHKTKHWYFVMNNVLALIFQFAIFASVIILM